MYFQAARTARNEEKPGHESRPGSGWLLCAIGSFRQRDDQKSREQSFDGYRRADQHNLAGMPPAGIALLADASTGQGRKRGRIQAPVLMRMGEAIEARRWRKPEWCLSAFLNCSQILSAIHRATSRGFPSCPCHRTISGSPSGCRTSRQHPPKACQQLRFVLRVVGGPPQGMLPDPQHAPAGFAQRACHELVPCLVLREFPSPERRVALGLGRVLRAAVPETAIHKDR